MSGKELARVICNIPGIGGLGFVCPVIDSIFVKKEPFQGSGSDSSSSSGLAIIMIFNSLISLVAFYFVFKCGGKFMDFIAACCCSMCYVAYRLAIPC